MHLVPKAVDHSVFCDKHINWPWWDSMLESHVPSCHLLHSMQ